MTLSSHGLTRRFRQLDSVYMRSNPNAVVGGRFPGPDVSSVPPTTARTAAPPLAIPSPALAWYAVLALLGSVVTGLLLVLDPRQLAGEPLWLKPLKFFLSAAIAAATIEGIVRWSCLPDTPTPTPPR